MSKKKSSLLVKYLNLYRQKPSSKVFAPLAESYRKLGMIDEALKVLSDGLTHNPNYVLGHLVLANCYYDQDKFDKAYEALKPFVQENIENISLQKLFAQSCLKTGRLEESLQTFKYLMFLNPKDDEVLRKVKALEDDLRVSEPVKKEELSYKEMYPDSWVEVNFHQNHPQTNLNQEYEEEETIIEEDSADNWEITQSKIGNVFKGQEEEIEHEKSRTIREQQIIEEPPIKPVQERETKPKSTPVITHTLVELYCEQKHYDKAREILEKILELNPDDEKSYAKLEEIKHLEQRNDYEEVEHEKLLNYIEQNVKAKDPTYEMISDKFNIFLEALRSKAAIISM